MTISEKIADKKAKIALSETKIAKEQERITKLRKEIDCLESLEIKAFLKEIDLPLDQVKELLKSMKPTPTVAPSMNTNFSSEREPGSDVSFASENE